MTETIRSTQVRTLYTIAVDDESTLQYPLPDRIFGFHAQQSCEKLFKALLSAHGRDFPMTHVLLELTRLLTVVCNEQFPALPYPLASLQPFAVQFRYDEGAQLTISDRLSIRETVANLRAFTLRRILELQQP